MSKNFINSEDRLILESYKSILDGLSEFIGPSCEIILHSLEDIDHAAIKVINGHFTGRVEGAPITDLALNLLKEIKKSPNNHKNLIYFNSTKLGEPIRSATLPIMGKNGKIIGLICLNMYLNLPLHVYLDSLLTIPNDNCKLEETFVSNTDELIINTLEEVKMQVQNNSTIPASCKNKEIIFSLCKKEIFNFKESVPLVAKKLSISKNTVYLHLRNFSKMDM